MALYAGHIRLGGDAHGALTLPGELQLSEFIFLDFNEYLCKI